ncbi:hypothetical protein D9758_017995 [Tetrapyrgos nigripes]|uniref:Uncharacterized protein n=1 Tax=Tetrapyrgos nigripes TaxID=182062 RepID=A0A8H5EYF2_9AGAR|nr:hypothetical protein D9758_017995 [Tetrapyrgos nigripes]
MLPTIHPPLSHIRPGLSPYPLRYFLLLNYYLPLLCSLLLTNRYRKPLPMSSQNIKNVRKESVFMEGMIATMAQKADEFDAFDGGGYGSGRPLCDNAMSIHDRLKTYVYNRGKGNANIKSRFDLGMVVYNDSGELKRWFNEID